MPVFDCEGDGLHPTKFHVLSYYDEGTVVSLTDPDDMARWLESQTCLIGHYITLYDIPHLERVLGIKIRAKLIDTLALSWYLAPKKVFHGLEWWGEDFGVKKPPVQDWENQPLEVYIHRCEEDVKINQKLWERFQAQLIMLYNVRVEQVEKLPIISYLMFKMDCAREQERSKWLLDTEKCSLNLLLLEKEKAEKAEKLALVMPQTAKWESKSRPKKPYKKDGSLSVEGEKWKALTEANGLTFDHEDDIPFIKEWEAPNPSSSSQQKEWLFSLGWEPATFKEVGKEGETKRRIPQIKKLNDSELCDSVIKLIDEHPQVALLEKFSALGHRIGLLKGFLRDVDEEGFLKARIHGLTNTLRFKHTEIVNLPKVDTPYGEYIRECLISREGHVLCGADMASLESMTKRHYMFPHDPDYVMEMSRPGFDEHLDLAVKDGALTYEQYEDHVNGKASYKKIRSEYKPVNYAGIYGIGKDKLSRQLKTTPSRAKRLLDAYWSRNWSIKIVAAECKVKTVWGQQWLYNPVSKFWYSLRAEKDRFSTLNQGTGVYCFDKWVAEVRKVRPQMTAQFHDEGVWEVKEGCEYKMEELLKESIKKVNKKLKLNVDLDINIKFGEDYASVH